MTSSVNAESAILVHDAG